MAMATMTKSKTPTLSLVVWANIQKWMMIRGVDDEQLALSIGLKQLSYRKKELLINIDELEKIASFLAVEPEKLMER